MLFLILVPDLPASRFLTLVPDLPASRFLTLVPDLPASRFLTLVPDLDKQPLPMIKSIRIIPIFFTFYLWINP
jgi:hypothetical protein